MNQNKLLYNIVKIASSEDWLVARNGLIGAGIGAAAGAASGGVVKVIANLIQKKKITDNILKAILTGAGIGGLAGGLGGAMGSSGYIRGAKDTHKTHSDYIKALVKSLTKKDTPEKTSLIKVQKGNLNLNSERGKKLPEVSKLLSKFKGDDNYQGTTTPTEEGLALLNSIENIIKNDPLGSIDYTRISSKIPSRDEAEANMANMTSKVTDGYNKILNLIKQQ